MFHGRRMKGWWMCLLLLFCVPIVCRCDFNITTKYEFSPDMAANPAARPSMSNMVTKIRAVFSNHDAIVDSDRVARIERSVELPAANGGLIPCVMEISITPETVIRYHQLIGIMPRKTIVATSIIRQGRNSDWFLATGNVHGNPNTQSLTETIIASALEQSGDDNVINGMRRLLSLDDDDDDDDDEHNDDDDHDQDMDAETQKIITKHKRLREQSEEYFISKTQLRNRRQDVKTLAKYQQNVRRYQEIMQAMNQVHHTMHAGQQIDMSSLNSILTQSSLKKTRRNLLQEDELKDAKIGLNSARLADLDAFLDTTNRFLKNQDNNKASSVARTAVEVMRNQLDTLKLQASEFARDLNLQRQTNASIQETLDYQKNFNKTVFEQLDALAKLAESREIISARGDQLYADGNLALSAIDAEIQTYRVTNSTMLQPLLGMLESFNISLQNVKTMLQATDQRVDGLFSFANSLNNNILLWYTQEILRRGETVKYHELVHALETFMNMQVIRSDAFPAQEPLGFIPIQEGNLGHFYQFTVQYTTTQTADSLSYFEDTDMRRITNYRQSNSAYAQALGVYDSKYSSNGGTGETKYLHLRQIRVECTNEFINSQKNLWPSLQDILNFIGPVGCTPGVNCRCWVHIRRQRCVTHQVIGATAAPVYRENIYDGLGCVSSSNPATAIDETNKWFPENVAQISQSLTHLLGTETVTSLKTLAEELDSICRMSTCNKAQSEEGILPAPSASTVYAPFWQHTGFGQSGAQLTDLIAVVNNVSYCGRDVKVFSKQSIQLDSPTLPFAFWGGAHAAFLALLKTVGPQFAKFQYGTRDAHIDEHRVPYHTPPAAACPTCRGMSESGSMLERLDVTKIAATTRDGVPLYLVQEVGREQHVSIKIRALDPDKHVFTPIEYAYDHSDMIDHTAQVSKFSPLSFFWAGWMSCSRVSFCPSGNPGFVPTGTSYVYDVHRGAISAHNDTRARQGHLDYYVDLSLSGDPTRYTLFDPVNESLSHDPFHPPKVITADQFQSYYDVLKIHPDHITDSLHRYIRTTTVDADTGQVRCTRQQQGGANMGSYPDGELCTLFEREIVRGMDPNNANAMDEVPYLVSEQIAYTKELLIEFPGALVTLDDSLVDPLNALCPGLQHMQLRAVENHWVTLDIQNRIDAERNLTVSVFFDALGCVYNSTNVTLEYGTIYHFPLGQCDVQHIKVLATGPRRGTSNHASNIDTQLCMNLTANIRALYDSQTLRSAQHTVSSDAGIGELLAQYSSVLLVNDREALTRSISTSSLAQQETSVNDFEYKMNLYMQTYIVNHSNQRKLNITKELSDYMNEISANVTRGTAVVVDENGVQKEVQTVDIPQEYMSKLSDLQQQLIDVDKRASIMINQAVQNLFVLAQNDKVLEAEGVNLLQNAMNEALKSSNQLERTLNATAILQRLIDSRTENAEAHLANMRNMLVLYEEKLRLADIAANQTLFMTPDSVENPQPRFPFPELKKGFGSFWDIFNGFKDLGDAIVDVAEKTAKAMAKVFDPSCFLGVCWLTNLWTYILYFIYIVIAILLFCVISKCMSFAADVKTIIK